MSGTGERTTSALDSRPPSRAPTVRDVATRAGVSPQTVSNAFASPSRLAEATLERVQAAVRDLGFSPNLAARALRGRRTAFIGVGVADLGHSDMRSFAAMMHDSAGEVGHLVQIVDRIGLQANRDALGALASCGAAAIISVDWGAESAVRRIPDAASICLDVRLIRRRIADLAPSPDDALGMRVGVMLQQALRLDVERYDPKVVEPRVSRSAAAFARAGGR